MVACYKLCPCKQLATNYFACYRLVSVQTTGYRNCPMLQFVSVQTTCDEKMSLAPNRVRAENLRENLSHATSRLLQTTCDKICRMPQNVSCRLAKKCRMLQLVSVPSIWRKFVSCYNVFSDLSSLWTSVAMFELRMQTPPATTIHRRLKNSQALPTTHDISSDNRLTRAWKILHLNFVPRHQIRKPLHKRGFDFLSCFLRPTKSLGWNCQDECWFMMNFLNFAWLIYMRDGRMLQIVTVQTTCNEICRMLQIGVRANNWLKKLSHATNRVRADNLRQNMSHAKSSILQTTCDKTTCMLRIVSSDNLLQNVSHAAFQCRQLARKYFTL